MSVFWNAPTVSIIIACCALLISFISITLSVLSYRKDRWKLLLEAWIKPRASGNPPTVVRGYLFVKLSNIGRRAVTIEKICLQLFEDEIEGLSGMNSMGHSTIERIEHIGYTVRFRFTNPKGFPVQLGENTPLTAEMILLVLDPVSRRRFCLVYVTGRKPIKIQCWIGGTLRPKPRKFSGS
jgi:hypothetical protein